MVREIKYIGFYNLPNNGKERVSSLAATNKIDYICDVMVRAGYGVSLISPSWIEGKGIDYVKKIQLAEFKRVTFFPSIGSNNKIRNYISIVISLSWLFFYLILNAKKGEKVVVYHSPWIALPLILSKRIKKFKLVLEVEEVYSDVSSLHKIFDKFEKKVFECSDYFLFSTDLLSKKINKNRPFLVLYGSYNVPKKMSNPPNDGKIHLIYAGIIDSHKAGAFNAIETALYLNDNYIIHVIGFGEIAKLEKRILEINKISKCKVFYEGIKQGDEYIEFCQSCHIGLSTQNIEGAYTESSFPSKILSYLSMGLNVVSGDISCVKKSKVSSLVTFYKGDSKNIAASILTIDMKSSEYITSEIKKIGVDFENEIKNIID